MLGLIIVCAIGVTVVCVWWFYRHRKDRRSHGVKRWYIVYSDVPPSIIPGLDRKHEKGWRQPACDFLDNANGIPPEIADRAELWRQYTTTVRQGWTVGSGEPGEGISFEEFEQRPDYYLALAKDQGLLQPENKRKRQSGQSSAVGASTRDIQSSGYYE